MLTSRCTVVKANARPAAQRAARATPRAVVVKAQANKQSGAAARATGDSVYRTHLAAGFAAAALLLSQQPALAGPLDALTGNTPTKEVGSTILNQDLEKVDNALKGQKDGAVRQAAVDLKDQVVEQAESFQKNLSSDQAPPVKANGILAQKPTAAKAEKQAAQGLQANLAQLKSLLGL